MKGISACQLQAEAANASSTVDGLDKADLDKSIRQPPPLLVIPLSVHSVLLHHGAPLVHVVVPVLMGVLMTVPIPMRMLMAVLMLVGLAVAVALGVLMCRVLPLLRDEAAAALGTLKLALQLLPGGRLQPGLHQAVRRCSKAGMSPPAGAGRQATARAGSGTIHSNESW